MVLNISYQQAKSYLKPVMKDTWEVEQQDLIRYWQMGDSMARRLYSVPYIGIANSFAAVVEFRQDENGVMIDNDQLKAWDLDPDTVWKQTVDNLEECSPGEFKVLDLKGSKVYFSNWEDGLDASRVVLPGFLSKLPVYGHHVVFMPIPELLIVTGMDDLEGLAVGFGEIENAQKKFGTALPPMPVAIIDGTLFEFQLPADHSLYNRFMRQKTKYFARIYEEQKRILKEHRPDQLQGAFVAGYARDQDSEARIYSSSTVTSGRPILLPRTDMLAFMGADQLEPLAVASWETVMNTAGELFQDLELYPPRFFCAGFPSQEQLADLGMQQPYGSSVSEEKMVSLSNPAPDAGPKTDGERTVIAKKCFECQESFPQGTVVCPHDGTQLATVLGRSLTGLKLVGRYELLDEIGRGGMGVIYRARDAQADKQSETVAIKLLLNDASVNEVIRSRFMVEARAASSLDHPNVIKVHEFSISEDGLPFMVMDYLSGMTLDDLLATGDVDVVLAIDLIIQVCDALAHAHRRNVIHRDIKPGNIIVIDEDDEKKAIVVDFGIAKIFAQPGKTSMHLTQSGEVFGSPLYMSPEQCMGQKIDSRSDVYSLGCVLYECIVGESPFDGENMLNVIFKHINEHPRKFADDDMDRAIEEVILKALSKDPEDRHQSMHAFRKHLERCLEFIASYDESTDTTPELVPGENVAGGEDRQLAYFRQLAENGFPAAQLELAIFFREGIFVEQNGNEALEWCLKAATQEYVPAMSELGSMYYIGKVTERDYDKAFYWLSKAARHNDPYSVSLIARMYETGQSVEEDFGEALRWYERAAELEDVEAQKAVGDFYLFGKGYEKDVHKAVRWYIRAANQGDLDIQVQLGLIYYHNQIGYEKPDYEEALRWFWLAADQGHARARLCIALAYEKGFGVKKDTQKCLELMTESAEGGYEEALYYLGLWHNEGTHGLKVNLKKAIRYFRQAAEAGSIYGQYELGVHYVLGEGVARNFKTGIKWFQKAIEGGNHAGALFQMALLYQYGNGVPEDEDKYVELMTEAASAGSDEAQFQLGNHFSESGDTSKARFWWKLAAGQNHKEAKECLEKLDG